MARARFHKPKKASGTPATTKPKLIAPASRHENIFFTLGSTKNNTKFKDTVQRLVRYVSTALKWKYDPVLCKAMTYTRDPVFELLVKIYYNNVDTETTVQGVQGVVNILIKDYFDYVVKTGNYICKISR